jgi:hypothetical protein
VYWFELVDDYVALFVVFLVGAAECLAITCFYGTSRLADEVLEMTGKKVAVYEITYAVLFRSTCAI